ncbi:chromodomain-helicase-DNA-binding protein 2-like isoform X2 [Thamnophis elegans]|nr:chromodomain-helicase-DNA-binding protein 2-like isoform X2 [Thamnophis elegans]
MRPVKNSLRQLDKPESGLSDHDLLEQTRNSLLNIGDHIADCLKIHSEPDVLDIWRRNLWVFVSKFIEFNTQKLHKLYKMASQKRAREQEEQKKKEETTSGKWLRPETPGPSRDIPLLPFPQSPHSQNLQQPSPQPSQIHGHEFMKYHQPNRRDFGHTGRREWQRDPQFNYSWNVYTNWGRNRYQPYEPRWHREHHYADCQARREQYQSSGNYQPSNVSRKRPYDPYNSERNYRGQPDYRYCYEAKRQRLDEFRPQNYPEDYQRMADYRPPLSHHGQGPSDHYRPFHPDKSADYKQLLLPPHSHLSDPRSPPSQKSPLGIRSSIQYHSLLDRPLEQRNNPEYKWSGRKT